MNFENVLRNEVGRLGQGFASLLPDFPAASLVDRRCEMAIDSREGLPGDFSQKIIQSPPICLEPMQVTSAFKERVSSVFDILNASYLSCLEDLYMEQLELVPFTSSPHVVRGIGDSFVESHELGVVRYSDSGKRQKPYMHEGTRVTPNPNWVRASYFDQYFVQRGWLLHAHPQGEEGGKWSYHNEYNFETNPDGKIGHFKGVITARFKMDLSKVLRFRVSADKL